MSKGIKFYAQNAGQKYKRFEGLDKKNMKNHSVEFI